MNLESYKLTTGIVQKEMLDESLPFFNLDTSIGISIKLVAFALINLPVRAVGKIKNYLNTAKEALFEIVHETKDLGDKIWFKLRKGMGVAEEVEISKAELTAEQIKISLEGCFTGDTLVMTEKGLKRIDSIQEGDLVLSQNTKTGECDYKPVIYVYKKSTKSFINLTISGNLIETTPSHLFMLEDGSWRAAENLKVGDKVITSNGLVRNVDSTEILNYNDARAIYNLNVEGYHTYFVGYDELLVHNNCGFSLEELVKRTGKSLKTLINENLGSIVSINGKRISLPSAPHGVTPGHWDTMVDKAIDLAQHSDAEEIWLNKGLSNVNEINKIDPNRRPDLMVKRADGKIDQYEVPSITDDPDNLWVRMQDNKRILGDLGGGTFILPIK